VVQSIGSSSLEACLNILMIIGEDVSSRFKGKLVVLVRFCKERARPVKVVACKGGMI